MPRWAIQAPKAIRLGILYLIYNTIPLHSLVAKQIIRYFHGLECSLAAEQVSAVEDTAGSSSCMQTHKTRCAAKLLEAATTISTPCGIICKCTEGLLVLCQ